jgi:hypothetical protein
MVRRHSRHRMTSITVHDAVMSHDLLRSRERARRKNGEQRPADEASETASLTRPVETHGVTKEPPGIGVKETNTDPGYRPRSTGSSVIPTPRSIMTKAGLRLLGLNARISSARSPTPAT